MYQGSKPHIELENVFIILLNFHHTAKLKVNVKQPLLGWVGIYFTKNLHNSAASQI